MFICLKPTVFTASRSWDLASLLRLSFLLETREAENTTDVIIELAGQCSDRITSKSSLRVSFSRNSLEKSLQLGLPTACSVEKEE